MELANKALNTYKSVDRDASILGASPHDLIAKLLAGAINSIEMAKQHLSNNNIPAKSNCITSAVAIIADGLRSCLNLEAGGEIAENLDALYDYMVRQLLKAHARNDPAIMDEVIGLLKEIKAGWDAIKPEESTPEQFKAQQP
jgi:flagellar protein FliS